MMLAEWALVEWLSTGEVGISSKTMAAALLGTIPAGAGMGWNWDVPHDPDDFRRCLLFARRVGLAAEHRQVIKERVPWFAPVMDRWDELETLYEKESPKRRCPKLYALLQELREESLRLDGWTQRGPGSWEKRWEEASKRRGEANG